MADMRRGPMLPSTIMRRIASVLFAAAALSAVCLPALAQKFVPRAFLFKGDPEYSSQ